MSIATRSSSCKRRVSTSNKFSQSSIFIVDLCPEYFIKVAFEWRKSELGVISAGAVGIVSMAAIETASEFVVEVDDPLTA